MVNLSYLISWKNPKILAFLESLWKNSLISHNQILKLIFLHQKINNHTKNKEDFELIVFLSHFLIQQDADFILQKNHNQIDSIFVNNLKNQKYSPTIESLEKKQKETLIVYENLSDQIVFKTLKNHLAHQKIKAFFKRSSQIQWISLSSFDLLHFLEKLKFDLKTEVDANNLRFLKIVVPSKIELLKLKYILEKSKKITDDIDIQVQTIGELNKEASFLTENNLIQTPQFFVILFANQIPYFYFADFLETLSTESKIFAYHSSLQSPLSLAHFTKQNLVQNQEKKPIFKTSETPPNSCYKIIKILDPEILNWINQYLIPEIKDKQIKCHLYFSSLHKNTLTYDIVQDLVHFRNQIFYARSDKVTSILKSLCLKILQQKLSSHWVTGSPVLLTKNYPSLNLFKYDRGIIISNSKESFVLFENLEKEYQIYPLNYFQSELYSPWIKPTSFYNKIYSNTFLISPTITPSFIPLNLMYCTKNTINQISYQIDSLC